MKKVFAFLFLCVTAQAAFAQKVDYKKNIISVDKAEVAKVEVTKENFGLTKNFDLLALNGEKLVIAVLATDFEADKNDNTTMYYRFTFVPTNQVGVFKISSLTPEKSFANLIGKSGIIEGNTLNESKVKEFIAKKGFTPKIAIDYTLVSRNKSWPIELQENKEIKQSSEVIGKFVSIGNVKGMDRYEFYLPNGILIAKVGFAGGNNAQNFELFTPKDNQTRMVSSPEKHTVKFLASSIDANELTLKRISKWLVDNNYL